MEKVAVWFRPGEPLPLFEELLDDIWATIAIHLPPASLGPLFAALRSQYPPRLFVTGEREWRRYFSGLLYSLWRRMNQRDFSSPFEQNYGQPCMLAFFDRILATYEHSEDERYDELPERCYAAMSWARAVMVMAFNGIETLLLPVPTELLTDFERVLNGPDAPLPTIGPNLRREDDFLIDPVGSKAAVSQPMAARLVLGSDFDGQSVSEWSSEYDHRRFIHQSEEIRRRRAILFGYTNRYSTWDTESVKQYKMAHPELQQMIDMMRTLATHVTQVTHPDPRLIVVMREGDPHRPLTNVKEQFGWWGRPGSAYVMRPRPAFTLERRFVLLTDEKVILIDGFSLAKMGQKEEVLDVLKLKFRIAIGVHAIDVDQIYRASAKSASQTNWPGCTAFDFLIGSLMKLHMPKFFPRRGRIMDQAVDLFIKISAGQDKPVHPLDAKFDHVLLDTLHFGLQPSFNQEAADVLVELLLSPKGRQQLETLDGARAGKRKLTMFERPLK
jgi:hypothetical protein